MRRAAFVLALLAGCEGEAEPPPPPSAPVRVGLDPRPDGSPPPPRSIFVGGKGDFSDADYLEDGYSTVLVFTLDVGAGKILVPRLEDLVLKYRRVILRKVDMRTLHVATHERLKAEFGLDTIPTTAVFGEDHAFVGSVVTADGNMVDALLRQAGAR